MSIKPVILCGGYGTRLWPESRKSFPKQFIKIFEGKSLLDLTLERVKDIKNFSLPIIVSSKDHSFLVKESMEKATLKAELILEPAGKNTTAAIYLAARASLKEDNLIILPSDHFIPDKHNFIEIINYINILNDFTKWITLGIKPFKAVESYGYIETFENTQNKLLKVKSFIEKPNIEAAKKMIIKNNYFWNSGIFLGNALMIINSIKRYAPQISDACDNAFENKQVNTIKNEISFKKNLFDKIPSQSIDYAVMEKEKNINLYPLNCQWSDMGSWDSFFEVKNTNLKNKNIIEIDSKNNFIRSHKRVIATIGIDDLIIIDSDNATLITKKTKSEKVKEIVMELNNNNMNEALEHTFENRPWGKFENLLVSKHCKVKKLEIYPDSRLSLQYHNYRSEHWLVVEGEAFIYLDGKNLKIKPGQSIDIPLGSHHYIENKTNKPLVIIETQLGTYFGEDDIVRLDDPYER